MSHCGMCGGHVVDQAHEECERRRELEPPRFCAECGRRMVVQVTPTGWTARCGQHGVSASSQATASGG